MKNKYPLLIISSFFFTVFMLIGSNLAQRKPIWNDEILTQTQAIDQLSYGSIAMGSIKGEGNNHPLFYLAQKAICDIVRYKFPKPWEGEYLFADPRSQSVMRIGPNVFMSLSLVLVFYFFSWHYSLRVGFFALLVALLSPMIWIYWVEARPYSLWFLLSVAQSLLLLQLIKNDSAAEPKIAMRLAIIHILLALTTMASAVQIVIAAVFIFLLEHRPWRHYIGLTVLPLMLCALYYSQSTKYLLEMPASWGKLLFPHLALDQMVFFLIYILTVSAYALKEKRSWRSFINAEVSHAYLVFFLLIVAATVGYFILQGFIHIDNPHNRIKDKYFLYVTPVVIIATVLFSVDLMRNFRRDPWIFINVLLILAGFLTVRFFSMYLEVSHSNLILNYLGEYW